MVGRPPYSLDSLPKVLPIFPLNGVLLLPGGRLPLHIFEPRYLSMVDDALAGDRMIGMVQPRAGNPEESMRETVGDTAPVFDIGCAGRITSFSETEDNRYLITLGGVIRFHVAGELELRNGYRRIEPAYGAYEDDLIDDGGDIDNRDRLLSALRAFLELKRIETAWTQLEKAPDEALVTTLAMICPFDGGEKQALLECATLKERSEMLVALMEMALHGSGGDASGAAH